MIRFKVIIHYLLLKHVVEGERLLHGEDRLAFVHTEDTLEVKAFNLDPILNALANPLQLHQIYFIVSSIAAVEVSRKHILIFNNWIMSFLLYSA